MDKSKTLTLEEAFQELDSVIGKMNERDLPLEESFRQYQKGVKLIEYCTRSIDRVEKKLIEIRGVSEDEGSEQ